ncbi:hypothetical protein [Rhodococcus sp. NPDC127528]|uniref:hypothetical protein n=1 Tax=unclassified Rhodococcus (in: high G+C Gram-positive bacteria) TaxID=192944 RepID=UPI00362DBCF0
MPEIASRRRTQPAPPHIVYRAIVEPDRDQTRPWLILHHDEQRPTGMGAVEPHLVVWSSLWPLRPDARVRFEIVGPPHGSTTLRWTVTVDDPIPEDETIVRMRTRVNELINANLRFTFGQ